MIIYITRHGQPLVPGTASDGADPDYPPGDPPLSDLGREQARRLGQRLKADGFAGRIYASPYRRTTETAHVIAGVLDTVIWPEPAIREYTGPNITNFQGATLDALRSQFPRIAPEAVLPHPWWTLEQETTDEHKQRPAVEARVRAFLEPLAADGGEDILLVGHGASCHAAIRYGLRLVTDEPEWPPVVGWNCALTALRLPSPAKFILLGDTAHLEPHQVTSNRRTAAELLAERNACSNSILWSRRSPAGRETAEDGRLQTDDVLRGRLR